DAPDAVFQAAAVTVVNERDFAGRVLRQLVLAVPGRHPVLDIGREQGQPVIPALFVKRRRFLEQKRAYFRELIAHESSPSLWYGCLVWRKWGIGMLAE